MIVEHKYLTGDPGQAIYFDGTVFKPHLLLEDQVKIIKEFLTEHHDEIKKYAKPEKLEVLRFFKDFLLEEKSLFQRLKKKD